MPHSPAAFLLHFMPPRRTPPLPCLSTRPHRVTHWQSHNLLPSIGASCLDLPNLKDLNIECNKLNACNAVHVLLQCAAFCTQLRSLCFGANGFGPGDLHAMISTTWLPIDPALSQKQDLLSETCYSHEDAEKMSDGKRGSVGRKGCCLVDIVARAAREKDCQIKSRSAPSGDYNSLLNSAHATYHLDALLKTLTAQVEATAPPAASLQFLNLFGCNLNSSCLVKLAEALRRLPVLLELNLSLNCLSGDGLCPVLECVSTSLQTLILRNAGVTAAGFVSAKRHFSLMSLTHLDLSDNIDLMTSGFVFMLESCAAKSLVHLCASNCGIDLCSSYDMLPSLLAIFRRAVSLNYLDLSCNNLGVSVVEGILRSMSPEPQLFGRPKFTNRIAFDALPTHHALAPWSSPLQHLNLSCTACDDNDESNSRHFDKWFDSILVYFSNITHLFLSHNHCIFNISSSIHHLSKLAHIDLSHCKNLLTVCNALFQDADGRSCSVLLGGCGDLEHPPKKVAEAGLSAIRQFISSTKQDDSMVLRHVKVAILGNSARSRRGFLRRLANIADDDDKSFDEINQIIRELHFCTNPWKNQLSFKVSEKRPMVSFWNFPEDLDVSPHVDFYMSSHQTLYFILFDIADSQEVVAQEISHWLRAIFHAADTQPSIRIHLIGSDLSSPSPCISEAQKQSITDIVQSLLSALGLLAHYNSKNLIFLDWWSSADPRFAARMVDKVFNCAAELLDGPETLRFPVLYQHVLEEVKELARRCQDKKSLPLIKLSDIPLHMQQCFRVLSGSHRNPRKLQAIKMCSEAGVLIYFRDQHEQDWICVNMNFGVDVTTSFINFTLRLKSSFSAYNRCCLLAHDDLFKIFSDVFQSSGVSVSWYASSLTHGSIHALFAFFEAQKLLLPVLSPQDDRQSEGSVVYLVPTLLRAQPDNWRSVFGHFYSGLFAHGALPASWGFGAPITVAGLRFLSSNVDFYISPATFLQITLYKCLDHRHMWQSSFLLHVSGVSLFVRRALPASYLHNTLFPHYLRAKSCASVALHNALHRFAWQTTAAASTLSPSHLARPFRWLSRARSKASLSCWGWTNLRGSTSARDAACPTTTSKRAPTASFMRSK